MRNRPVEPSGTHKPRAFQSGVGIYGCVLGPVLAVLSGHLRLNVHEMGVVVLGQAIWFVIVGVLLWRVRSE